MKIPENGANGGNGASGLSMEDADRSSMLSESFRQTLVSLLRTKPRAHNPVYVITSAGPGEGKTTLSANLARAMAEIGQRVLLVDADLRRPHVHSLLRLGDHIGLSDILAGDNEPQDLVLDDYIQTTQIENLSVMSHGLTESETPLFFSPRMEELVAMLRVRFDCILLDTAPALPFPDARLWGKHADGVVLVVRSGVTTRDGASSACERFLSDGIPVLGTILNDWTPEDSGAAYYRSGYEKSRV
jgi:capsular exopolysaccharide synthesis family protein